jgi:hypothetical protein
MPACAHPRLTRNLRRIAARAARPAAAARARSEAIGLIEREALVAPAISYRVAPLSQARTLVAHAAGATAVAACACTLGSVLEARVRKLFADGRKLVAFELDAIGSELLYRLSRTARALIRREAAAAGLRTGDELAPGHIGLALGRQAALLEIAGAAEHGISVSPRSMLSPVKSLTFAVPLGQALGRTPGGLCARCASRERCRARLG